MAKTTIILKKGEGRSLKAGGAWIYDNEIDTITTDPAAADASVVDASAADTADGGFQNGSIVAVRDFDGYPMGKGFINLNSKIRVRMLTRKPEQEIDRSFLRMRVENAWNYRKTVMGSGEDLRLAGAGDLNACRIIFGEADWLPGLVVDKYSDVLVVECLALGMEQLKDTVLEELINVLAQDGIKIRGVYERSDAPVRKKEGLQPYKGFWRNPVIEGSVSGDSPEYFDTNVEIVENGVHYLVDVVNGQKTGFFLDQKYNRLAMHRICKGKRVLDCFTHMGTFALNAGIAGAKEVTGLDISEFAIGQATENAKRNGLDGTVHFRAANVLDELPRLYEAGERYDVVILDPPAFTKSREATKNAIKGYREINMKGLKLVKDGGYLATCSCSHFMTQELFTEMMKQAAGSTHKRLRQVEFRTQSCDHPILWAADESYYLKFFIFQVVDER